MKDEPKAHHYVPAFYLRQWERPSVDSTLVEFRKIDQQRRAFKEKRATSTGFRQDLYSRKTGEPGVLDRSLESTYLSKLDSDNAVILQRLISGQGGGSRDDRRNWARFIVAQSVRAPEDMAEQQEHFEKMWLNPAPELNKWYASVRPTYAPASFREFLASLPDEDQAETWHSSFKAFIDGGHLLDFICKLDWGVRSLDDEQCHFLTSDRPIVTNNRLGHPEGYLLLPISPSKVFFTLPIQSAKENLIMSTTDRQLAKFVNRRIVEQAAQYVWSNNLADQRMVFNRIGKRPAKTFAQIAARHLRRIRPNSTDDNTV